MNWLSMQVERNYERSQEIIHSKETQNLSGGTAQRMNFSVVMTST